MDILVNNRSLDEWIQVGLSNYFSVDWVKVRSIFIMSFDHDWYDLRFSPVSNQIAKSFSSFIMLNFSLLIILCHSLLNMEFLMTHSNRLLVLLYHIFFVRQHEVQYVSLLHTSIMSRTPYMLVKKAISVAFPKDLWCVIRLVQEQHIQLYTHVIRYDTIRYDRRD